MKHLLLCCLYCVLVFSVAKAQKTPIDYADIEKAATPRVVQMSRNGQVVVYTVEDVTCIQATDNSWKNEFRNAYKVSITQDDQRVVFLQGPDSLVFFDVRTQQVNHVITDVISMKACSQGTGNYIAYVLKQDNKLVLYDMYALQCIKEYNWVRDFYFNDKGDGLLIHTGEELIYRKLRTGVQKSIMQAKGDISTPVFSTNGTSLAFIAKPEKTGKEISSLYYFSENMEKAIVCARHNEGELQGYLINNYDLKISDDGQRIFFAIHPAATDTSEDNVRMASSASVWSYGDSQLQLYQAGWQNRHQEFTAVVTTASKKIIILNEGDEDSQVDLVGGGNHLALLTVQNNRWEAFWLKNQRQWLYLINLEDGKRTLVKKNLYGSFGQHVSPHGQYIIWYDREERNYFTYDVSSKETTNLTAAVPVPVYDQSFDLPDYPYEIGIAQWLPNDSAVLIYDNFDVWRVDPRGMYPPMCLTNGYGRRHHIYFRCVPGSEQGNSEELVTCKGTLLLMAFDSLTKQNGFYRITGNHQDPEKLLMTDDLFYRPQLAIRAGAFNMDVVPVQAANKEVYVLTRRSWKDYPQLHATTDFKKLWPLTNLQPFKTKNWLTAELMHWPMKNGLSGEGILYKPENFDPLKKYPVIFHFYEKKSDALNNYLMPEWSTGNLSIPLYVSNGYLVFVADMYYMIGSPAESIVSTILSAAAYVSTFAFADTTKFGLQGHSFGGYEVNAIISRSNKFAAAVTAAGPADLVRGYGGYRSFEGVSNQLLFERGQIRIGATLYSRPDLYVKNSPLFSADKTSTPLLIVHNQGDGAVSFSQGVEWYNALKRSGQPVWLLQYDDGGHEVPGGGPSQDFTIRMQEFFDHYLKNKQAPAWMGDNRSTVNN